MPLRGPDSEKTSEPSIAFTLSRDLPILGRSECTEIKPWGRGEPCEASWVLFYGQKFLLIFDHMFFTRRVPGLTNLMYRGLIVFVLEP